jgi:hypothetical protein
MTALSNTSSGLVDQSLMFEAKTHEFWIRSIDANQETALYQMDKTTKAQDNARRWRDLKNQLDTIVAELSAAPKDDNVRQIPQALRDALWEEDVIVNGKSWRNQAGKTDFDLGELRSMSASIDTHISSFTDMSSKNTIETQKAITNVNVCVQGATNQVSQAGRQSEQVITNMYK